MKLKVIDVSHHQGKIDWTKVKADGVQGAIIRVSDSVETMDRECDRNIAGCERAGIPFGLYIYSRANNEERTRQEAEIVLNKARGHKLGFPIYIDLEQAGTESYAVRGAKLFGKLVQAEGYWCGVYANQNWFQTVIGNSLNEFTKWVARYGSQKPEIPNTDMWQYSSTGRVAGITENVDLNIAYRDFPKLIKGTGNGKVYYTIQKGDTLSGIAKKFGTTVSILKARNGIRDVNKIYAGERIRVK